MQESRTLTYSTDGTQAGRVAFGVFVFLVALAPTSIVAIQTVRPSILGPPSTDPLSILPGSLLALWGLWSAAVRDRVTVDEQTKTLRWSRSIFSIVLRTVVWDWGEITAIEIRRNPSAVRSAGYCAQVTGTRGTRELLSYFHSRHLIPKPIRETSRLLGLSLQIADGS